MINPKNPTMTGVIINDNSNGSPTWSTKIAEVYAPMARNAACHKEINPVKPLSKSSPTVRMI